MAIYVPDVQSSNVSKARGKATVKIASRADAAHGGQFSIEVDLKFDPSTDAYPTGTIKLKIDLSDSLATYANSTTVEQVSSMGKHTPTLFVTGRCVIDTNERGASAVGCRYWVMIANNKKREREGTPDIVGFLVYDRNGVRVSYGTGPVVAGDIEVGPTGN